MRKKIDIRHLAAALLAALMLLACLPVTQADAAGNTIHISSEAELRDLAASCALDTWSRDKNVVLDSDLTLADPSFLPIPAFGGSFDGQGHTIHNVSITDSLSPAGLFGVVQAGGSVRSLHVVGTVTPSGDGRSVGGIAGENNGAIEKCSFTGTVSGQVYVGGIAGHTGASGSILVCETRGAVIGDSMTGGITGYNEGLLADCTNSACVNVESTDPRLDLEDLDLTLTPDLSKLGQANTGASAADTGGIAGYSAGTLSDCVNHGAVGYQHIGYNTGGVVGRSCGQLLRCRNDGSIAGRKDVGGVAGQIEPYIQMDASPTYLSELNRQLYELKSLTDQAANDAQDGAGDVSGRLSDMNDYLKDALSDPQDPLAAITGFGSRLNDLNNSASGSVDTAADDLRDINSFHECCRMQGVTPGTRLIHAQLSHADERTQRELELPDDRVVEIERVRTADGVPVMLETNSFPLAYSDLLQADLSQSLYAVLEERGITPKRGIHEISLHYATNAQARLLEVDPGQALLLLREVVFDQHGRPLHTSYQLIRGDRFTFRI